MRGLMLTDLRITHTTNATKQHAILLYEESAISPFLPGQNRQTYSIITKPPVQGVIRSASLSCHLFRAHLRDERYTMTHGVQISEAQASWTF